MRQLLENLQDRWIPDHHDLTSNDNGMKYTGSSAAHSTHHLQHLKSFQFTSQSGHPRHVQGHISLDKLSKIIKHIKHIYQILLDSIKHIYQSVFDLYLSGATSRSGDATVHTVRPVCSIQQSRCSKTGRKACAASFKLGRPLQFLLQPYVACCTWE